MPTAILVDGGFFLHRYHDLKGNCPPAVAANDLHRMCLEHLRQKDAAIKRKLYRIFFYDCPPLLKKAHNPVSKKAIDFSKTPMAAWRLAFHESLLKKRKVALRLGYLNDRTGHWIIKPKKLKELLAGKIALKDLVPDDVKYDVKQKGVDMRIGLDIASLCFKKQVDQIVLIAGDSDFVPAAKLARREGIDFILDPMWNNIAADLHEHIDGMRSVFAKSYAPLPRPTPPLTPPPSANAGSSGLN
jgi:uncharacterized LabA/DUF88 family protein